MLLSFIFRYWGIISIVAYALSFWTICIAIQEKERLSAKIVNILIITAFPLVGCILYWIMRKVKEKRHS